MSTSDQCISALPECDGWFKEKKGIFFNGKVVRKNGTLFF